MSYKNNTESSNTKFWYDPKIRAIIYQAVTLFLIGLLSYYLYSNVQQSLERQSIATGFDFLDKEAAFEIGESPIAYSSADSYARA